MTLFFLTSAFEAVSQYVKPVPPPKVTPAYVPPAQSSAGAKYEYQKTHPTNSSNSTGSYSPQNNGSTTQTSGSTSSTPNYDEADRWADEVHNKQKERYAEAIKHYEQVTSTYRTFSPPVNPLFYRVKYKGKFGYMNSGSYEQVEPKYDSASPYICDALALVMLNKKYGYINDNGFTIIPLQYDKAEDFYNALALVKLNGKYGLINPKGATVVPFVYDDALPLSYGFYAMKRDGKWGFLDYTGAFKVPFEFDEVVSSFSAKTVDEDPTAVVIKGNAKFRINKGGILTGHKTDKVTGKDIVEVLERSTFTDPRDNQIYHTVKIGEQVWMVENLNVDRFSNNQKIKEANSEREWDKAIKRQEPAWCYYNGDEANGIKYGKLYNGYAVKALEGLAPAGWHIPTQQEWKTLVTLLGGKGFAGVSLKSESWNEGSKQSDNPNGFSALPGGKRDSDFKIKFNGEGTNADWWTSDEIYPGRGSSFNLFSDTIDKTVLVFLSQGLSVRCIKNADVVK